MVPAETPDKQENPIQAIHSLKFRRLLNSAYLCLVDFNACIYSNLDLDGRKYAIFNFLMATITAQNKISVRCFFDVSYCIQLLLAGIFKML